MRKNTNGSRVDGASRRRFLSVAGTAALGATAAGFLTAGPALAAEAKAKAPAASVGSLNRVLGLEHELVAAYKAFPGTRVLSKNALAYAQTFLAHHQTHVERLSAAIKAAGGAPVAAKSSAAYAKSLNIAALKSAPAVMKLALGLEKGAADAYIGAIATLNDPVLAQVIARLSADAAMHWGVIADALGTPMPQKAMSFGA